MNIKKHLNLKNAGIAITFAISATVFNFGVGNYIDGYEIAYDGYAKKDNVCTTAFANRYPVSKRRVLVGEVIKAQSKEMTRYYEYEIGKKGTSMFMKTKITVMYYGALDGVESYYEECFGV